MRASNIAKTAALEGVTYAQAAQGLSKLIPETVTKTKEAATQTQEQDKTPRYCHETEDQMKGKIIYLDRIEEQHKRNIEEVKEETRESTRRLLEQQGNTTVLLMEMIKRVWAATSIIMESEECGNIKKSDLDRYNAYCLGLRKRESKLKEIINKESDKVRTKNLDSTNSPHGDPREQQDDGGEDEETDEEDEEREEEGKYEDEGLDKYEIEEEEEEEAEIEEQDEEETDDEDQRNQEWQQVRGNMKH